HIMAKDFDPAGGRRQHPAHHMEQGGLTRAIRTDDRPAFALLYLHRDLLHGLERAEVPGEIVQVERRGHQPSAPILMPGAGSTAGTMTWAAARALRRKTRKTASRIGG